jgi:hypothetical protein
MFAVRLTDLEPDQSAETALSIGGSFCNPVSDDILKFSVYVGDYIIRAGKHDCEIKLRQGAD